MVNYNVLYQDDKVDIFSFLVNLKNINLKIMRTVVPKLTQIERLGF